MCLFLTFAVFQVAQYAATLHEMFSPNKICNDHMTDI